MFDKLKREAMRQGMKLMSNPKVMKAMADPRLMNAISQGLAFKGKVQSGFENTMRQLIEVLNLATKEDLEYLKRSLAQMEDSVNDLERKIDK